MKKVLITGASGFIGKFLVDEALKRDFLIYVAVRKTSKTEHLSKKNIQIVEFDFSDICKLNLLIYTLPQFDYIIHNAGLTKSLKKEQYFEVNCQYTKNLIEVLKHQNKIPKKFLFISSLAAVGPGDNKSPNPIHLNSTPKPVTSYGKSKLEAEKYIVEKGEIPYIIIRPTAVYGPGEKDIFESIKLINKGFDFQLGLKNQHLTFIYVKDLATLVLDAMESQQFNKTYFISDGNLYNSFDLGNSVSKSLNRKIVHIPIPVWLAKTIAAFTEISSRFSKNASALNIEKVNELSAVNWNCDIQPSKSDFNFRPEYNLQKGMNETIEWYQKQGWLKK